MSRTLFRQATHDPQTIPTTSMLPKPPPPVNFSALRSYAHTSHSVAYKCESNLPSIPSDILLSQQAAHDAKLTEAITEVRRRIIDEELSLATLHSQQTLPDSSAPDPPHKKLRNLKARKAAHDAGFQTIDYIPPADSPLNILLAYRSVSTVVARTNASIQTVEEQVNTAQALLKSEGSTLKEQKHLAEALRTRLDVLEEEERRIDVGADIPAQDDMVKAMTKKSKELEKMTLKLLKEMRYFLDSGLARMVAAEEMGGPVVGGELDVTLETGFNKKGKSRKGEKRIDEMWGQGEEDPEARTAREFKELLEGLMNKSLEASPYVELKKDSAISRFLVRAKVASFHPKDARRLKMVDFGSNVEDG